MKRYIRTGWYTGEPSSVEYGHAMDLANKRSSTDYCKVVHNNTGWLGVYATTPFGKYCIVRHGSYSDRYYTINKYNGGFYRYPAPLIKDRQFASLEDALQYLEENDM